MESDPYKILGVHPGASLEEVRRAYRSLIGRIHTDRARTREEKRMFELESKRLGEAFSILKNQRKAENFFGEERDFVKIMDLVHQKGLAEASHEDRDLIREANAQIEKVIRLGHNEALHQRALRFRERLKQIAEEQIQNASPAEFAAICDRMASEIDGPKSPIILEAFFASPRSLERPDLLERLIKWRPKVPLYDRSRSAEEEGPRKAIFTALSHAHWASNAQGRRMVTELLSEMPIHQTSNSDVIFGSTESFLDLAGKNLFSRPEWHHALETDAKLQDAYFTNVLRYLKKYNSSSSGFVHYWFSSPDVLNHPKRIEEIYRLSPDTVIRSMISFPHLRDSELFWTYYEKVMPYAERNIIFYYLRDGNGGLVGTKRGEEVLQKYFAMFTKDGERWKNQAELISIAKTLSSAHWAHNPLATQLMDNLIRGEGEWRSHGLVELLSAQTSRWPQESIELVSNWAQNPKGPAFLAAVIEDESHVYQRSKWSDGRSIDLAMEEILNTPRKSTWLSNPGIDSLVTYLFQRDKHSTYYVQKLLDTPELKANPKYPIWAHAASIKDYNERMGYLKRASHY
jgi:curved DNA-binding protein CbpA